jgi:hypothetical protein
MNPALKPATYTKLQLYLILPDLGMQPGPQLQPEPLEPTDPEPTRPRVVRIRGSMEERANKRKVKCKRCKGFGHFEKTCKFVEPTEDDDGIDEAATIASLKRYISYS